MSDYLGHFRTHRHGERSEAIQSGVMALDGVVALRLAITTRGLSPPQNVVYGSRTVEPVVRLASISLCAFAASFSLYFWLTGTFTAPLSMA